MRSVIAGRSIHRSLCTSISSFKRSEIFSIKSKWADSIPGNAVVNYGNFKDHLLEILNTSFTSVFRDHDGFRKEPQLTPTKPEFGDYQTNIAMIVAKELKLKPLEVAEMLKSAAISIDKSGDRAQILSNITISGPGFLNFQLSNKFIEQRICEMLSDPVRLGVALANPRQRVVVDFSSPNIAKEMHVGHLRSTIIGDTLARTLEFIGHDVLRLNHVGDWGTQFGMLIHYLNTTMPEGIAKYKTTQSIDAIRIGDLVEFYKAAKKRFDEDPNFAELSRQEVVKLQAGDEDSRLAWQAICDASRIEFQGIYDTLSVSLNERGESYYNPFLPDVVKSLVSEGVAVQSEGAICIFLPGYINPDGSPMPMIIQKSDGGYLYASTDLAAAKHRIESEKADRILYVTDAGQAQHFKMIFEVVKSSKLISNNLAEKVDLTHVPFGVVQGEDGKKFKTRSGETVKLKDLLQTAVELAELDLISRKASNDSRSIEPETDIDTNTNTISNDHMDNAKASVSLTDEEKETARVVGIAAVKYADLSMNRESNYRFSYKKMLSLTGNTAPYMLYAFVRIQGIKRKAIERALQTGSKPISADAISVSDIKLVSPEEIALGKHLCRFDEVVVDVARDLYPNKLCDYLFELSQKFNLFYERCPVLKAKDSEEQLSRTLLCSLTADILKTSLGLLGIDVVEKL